MAEINGSLSSQQEITGSTSPVGPMGPRGYTGNGIESIEKTGTSGLVDTYTITYTDGNDTTFEVTNGARGADGHDGANGQDGQDGADGADGISPTFETEQIEGGYRLTITDAEGTHTVDLMDGADGHDGQNGQDGADGEDGQDGVSPVISSSAITGGHRLTIIDAQGTTTVDVMDGEKGETGATGATGANGKDGSDGKDGANGSDGYSPTATVTKSGSTATISITDKNGTTTATVSDGAAGTTDYADMTNKPQINSVTLSGNKSLSDLGVHNIPSGGSTGQILAKTNGTDYNVQWKTNSLANLSGTYFMLPQYGDVLAYSQYMDWRNKPLREYMGYFADDGDGNVILEFTDGNLPGYEPAPGFGGYVVDNDSPDMNEQYDLIWQHLVTNEYGEYQSTTYWFLCKSQSTPYDLKIKRFTATFDDNTGEWSNLTEQTAPNTHEVSHTWIGTAAEYALLGSYDAHTIYYITQ